MHFTSDVPAQVSLRMDQHMKAERYSATKRQKQNRQADSLAHW